ncbi:MAG TPA: hypothetical protein VN200_03120 [Rhodoglobus sp.]|nr:hypothetical protein [Rhodoglobus sp.]
MSISRFLAGALMANAVPHGLAGLRGRPFPSPFGDPPGVGLSSPAENLVWSAANAAAGSLLLRRSAGRGARAGALSMALLLTWWFALESPRRRRG